MIENRLVGLKSREIYEAPAAVVLHAAHRAVEDLTLAKTRCASRKSSRPTYADLIYNGLWFGALRRDLAAYVTSSQQHVTGIGPAQALQGLRHRGGTPVAVLAVRARPRDLRRGRQFDYSAAEGFHRPLGSAAAHRRPASRQLTRAEAHARMKTWQGRIAAPAANLFESFTSSVVQDRRLAPYDVRVSQAHARALARAGLISPADADDPGAGAGGDRRGDRDG